MKKGEGIFIFIICLLIVISGYFIPMVSATETQMGVYQKGDCIELIQLCGDCTYNNITSIQYPNETKIILDVEMTKRGTEFNYTYCFPELNGRFNINGVGDLGGTDSVWAYTLTLTPNGEEPTTPKLIFHYGSILLLFLFFVSTIVGMLKVEDPKGTFALYWASHLLFVAITFMLWNGSLNLLTSAPFVISFFKIMFWVAIISVLPMIILSVAWMIYVLATCKDVQSLIDRGSTSEEAWDRIGRRKK